MAEIYIAKGNLNKALFIANEGLILFPESGGLYSIIGRISYELGELTKAEEMLIKSIELSNDSSSQLMKILSYVYIDLGKTNEAINLSKDLLDQNPDDPSLYYNLAVVYQRLVSDELDNLTDQFNNIMAEDNPKLTNVKNMYNKFNILQDNVKSARENFLVSSDLSIDENSAKESMDAAREMRKLLMQISDIYLPSLQEKLSEN